MKMKSLLSLASAFGLAVMLVFASAIDAAAKSGSGKTPPNIIFINVDDLNMSLGSYGDPITKTPNIDRLAKRGVQFDRAYCQYPVCNPSRNSFFSGVRPETSGIMDQTTSIKEVRPEIVFLPEHFKNNGYFTIGLGKNEHKSQQTIEWDQFEQLLFNREDGAPTRGEQTGRPAPGAPQYTVWRATEENDPELGDKAIARRAVQVLEEKRDRPLFLSVGFRKPHVPYVAPKRFFEMYPPERMPITKVPENDHENRPAAALAVKSNYRPDMPDSEKQQIMSAYRACVSYMDEQVGVILDALDRLKLWDSTVVVFFSDHGWHFGEHNWWAKASLFEPSARVPLIVAAPGVKAGVSPRVVELLDLFPALAEFAGLPPPPQGEGKSFAPLLKNPGQPWDKAAFTAMRRGEILGRSVRTERHRYTEWDEGRAGVELYDYETDPNEFKNLATDSRHAKTVAQMKALLERTQIEVAVDPKPRPRKRAR